MALPATSGTATPESASEPTAKSTAEPSPAESTPEAATTHPEAPEHKEREEAETAPAKEQKEKQERKPAEDRESPSPPQGARATYSGGQGLQGDPLRLGYLLGQGKGAIDDTAAHISLSEIGEDDSVPDAADLSVGKNGFDAVTRGDEHLTIFYRYKKDNPVVFLLLAYAPPLAEFDRVVRGWHPFGRIDDYDGDLGSGLCLQLLEHAVKLGFNTVGDNPGIIVNVVFEWNDVDLGGDS